MIFILILKNDFDYHIHLLFIRILSELQERHLRGESEQVSH
jgi:hypothetical protein